MASPGECEKWVVDEKCGPVDRSRRQFLIEVASGTLLAATGGSFMVDALTAPSSAEGFGSNEGEVSRLLETDHELAKQVDPHGEDENHEELLHGPAVVDFLGAANFFTGIKNLLPGGKGHIDSTRYAALGTLLAIKWGQSDQLGRQHLREEFKSVAISGSVIEGTILASEALKLDFAEAYRAVADGEIDTRDAIPLLTMFAAVTSPTLTTVGSAGILSKTSQDLARQLSAARENGITTVTDQLFEDENVRQDVYRILTAHVSNLSGFVLVGDPPFIAMAEKYGLPKAMEYQLHACLPLAMQSLYSANYRLQRIRLEAEGISGFELQRRSRHEAVSGMWRNKEVLVQMIAGSAANFAKVMSFRKSSQSETGIQYDFSGMIREKLEGVMQLAFKEHIDSHESHEATGSRTSDIDPTERAEAAIMAIKALGLPDGERNAEHAQSIRHMVTELTYLIDEGEYEGLRSFLANHGVSEEDIEIEISRVKLLRELDESINFGEIESSDESRRGFLGKIALAPRSLFRRVTNQDRIKNALGHASADVLNVFPFQALSVPFLVPIFQKGIDEATTTLESAISEETQFAGLDAEQIRELAVANMTAIMICAKSGIADNYVAAKIGLELMPDKPSYPLISAITGGRLTAIGNMANPTLIPLSEYGMAESIKKIPKGLPSVLLSLVWANILDLAKDTPGFPTPPKPKN